MDENKLKALDGVMAQIEKQYGKGAIMRLGQQAADEGLEVLPTGCLSLDLAIGVGGLPRGRIIEIFGLREHLVGNVRLDDFHAGQIIHYISTGTRIVFKAVLLGKRPFREIPGIKQVIIVFSFPAPQI